MRKHNPGKVEQYLVGDLVFIDKLEDNRTVPVKMGTQTQGPYQVAGYEENKVNVKLVNPWVGNDSIFSSHQDNLRIFKNKKPLTRFIDKKDDLDISKVNARGLKGCRKVAEHFGKELSDLGFMDLIGSRVKVHWSKGQALGSGWHAGTIVDWEPRLGKHLIKYDKSDDNGDRHWPQNLMSSGATSGCKFIDD